MLCALVVPMQLPVRGTLGWVWFGLGLDLFGWVGFRLGLGGGWGLVLVWLRLAWVGFLLEGKPYLLRF